MTGGKKLQVTKKLLFLMGQPCGKRMAAQLPEWLAFMCQMDVQSMRVWNGRWGNSTNTSNEKGNEEKKHLKRPTLSKDLQILLKMLRSQVTVYFEASGFGDFFF